MLETLILRYLAYERKLIQEFGSHPFFMRLPAVGREEFIELLLQIGHLSAEFVRWYEQAKLGLGTEEAKEVVRVILRDEIPTVAPTHQDNRLFDLQELGVPKELVLNTPPSSKTRWALRTMYRLVRYPQDHYDLRVLVTLRIAGEALVGETYRYVCPQLERFGLSQEKSKFYWPHFLHDILEDEGEGHSNAFDLLLGRVLETQEDLQTAKKTARAAFNLRYRLLDQFV